MYKLSEKVYTSKSNLYVMDFMVLCHLQKNYSFSLKFGYSNGHFSYVYIIYLFFFFPLVVPIPNDPESLSTYILFYYSNIPFACSVRRWCFYANKVLQKKKNKCFTRI